MDMSKEYSVKTANSLMASRKFNTLSELRDLVCHMELVAAGIKSGSYTPVDPDILDLSDQLTTLASQLREFKRQKMSLTPKQAMY